MQILLNQTDYAKKKGISRMTVLRQRKAGKIQAVKDLKRKRWLIVTEED